MKVLRSKGRLQQINIEQNDGQTRLVGKYDPAKHILFLYREREKHFMRILQAWGIDFSVFKLLKSEGLELLHIEVKGDRAIYEADVLDFVKHGIQREYGNYGLQIFLPEKYWRIL
jgi:RecB family endonuclease NucS